MAIEPGGKEGGRTTVTGGADQWLYVESGEGEAIVEGTSQSLRAGSLVLIERGKHP